MNKKVIILFFFIASIAGNMSAQQLIVNKDIRMPRDSIESVRLVSALNGFLLAVQQQNEENEWVLPSAKLETFVLLDEFKNIHLDGKGNELFKPYLTNIVKAYNAYLLQISYIGINNNSPMLRASFEILAVKNQESFLFSSPLSANTRKWKYIELSDSDLDGGHKVKFYYQDSIEEKYAKEYAQYIFKFDKKLKSPVQKTDIYLCDNFVEALKLTGVDYKLDYNGYSSNELSCIRDNQEIIIQGFQEFDPHDLFHGRAYNVFPSAVRNRYMICGYACIYGGSWGISWEDILATFKTRMKYDKKTDWLKLYFEHSFNYGENKFKPLLITEFINSLITLKVEREQGFPAVAELLSSGNMFNNRENFFKILEKVTGINEKNFNQEIGKLIKEEVK